MLRTIILFLAVCLSHHAGWCQDVINKKNGDTLNAKVLKVDQYSVTYRRFNNPDTFAIVIPKSEINYIVYQNGTADTFKITATDQAPMSHIYKGNYYTSLRFADMGKEDAKRYYKGYKPAKTAMVITSVFAPVYSLVPTAIIASTRPKEAHLGYPSPELMNNAEYRYAYTEKAFQIKKRKTWNGLLLGTGIIVGVELIIAGALIASFSHN